MPNKARASSAARKIYLLLHAASRMEGGGGTKWRHATEGEYPRALKRGRSHPLGGGRGEWSTL
eukprot:scaffold61326_cov28-Tisochrysis_lutea.AAC.2